MSSSADPGPDDHAEIAMMSVPEVAAALGVRDREVRSMLSEGTLIGVRRGGAAPVVPAALLVPGEGGATVVVPGLRGTLTQLADAGYSDGETVAWLFRENDELGSTPVAALTALRTHAVRRAAQALAF